MPAATVTTSAPRGAHRAIERYFEISLYLLIVTGFATLATTGKLDAASLVLVSAALLARGWLLLRGQTVKIPERWTTYFTVAYVVVYIADFLFLSQSFVTATVHLVLFSMVVKVFSVQRDRDHLYLAVLAFLEVLAAAVLTVDSVFLAAFSVFLLVAVATFVSMEMKRSAAAAATVQGGRVARTDGAEVSLSNRTARWGRGRPRWRPLPRALWATSVALMLSIFGGAALIFFLLPRGAAGYLGAFAPRNELVSGFSNDVNLGEIGVIQQSNSVVMHVAVLAGQADVMALKWRGIALDQFDGKRWTTSPLMMPLYSNEGRYDLGQPSVARFTNVAAERASTRRQMLRYRVLMEPVGMTVFFVAPTADLLLGPYRFIAVDRNGALSNTHDRQIGAYDVVSNVAPPDPDLLRRSVPAYSDAVGKLYLQLPPGLDARIGDLARQVTASQNTAYDKARAVEQYLSTSYGYTLQLPPGPVDDPVANFLFERKQGHCEYFASAMAVMLRSLGIPARIVNGFRTGEYNDVTGSYIIRARNAHSWVEAYFPGYGWASFDPTPAATRPEASGWNRAMLYLDAMREFWREWVINYDFGHQRALTSNATTTARRWVDDARTWARHGYGRLLSRARHVRLDVSRSPRKWGGRALASAGAILLLVFARPAVRGWRKRRLIAVPARAPRVAAGLWYERMARTVARRGWRKRPSQSPREFCAAIDNAPLRGKVESFTATYERARFGGSAEDASKLPELYEEVAETK